MFVCSVREHNKYIQPDTKKLEQSLYPVLPTDCLRKHSPPVTTKTIFVFQAKFSACWCSDEYRQGKQILIDCKEPGETLERTAPTCINCILIQSRCKAFSAGKLIVIPFSLNTIQLTRQTLFMSSLRSQLGLLHREIDHHLEEEEIDLKLINIFTFWKVFK